MSMQDRRNAMLNDQSENSTMKSESLDHGDADKGKEDQEDDAAMANEEGEGNSS